MNNSKVKVYNLESPRTGKPVANQFIIAEKINSGELETFQSYKSIIAKKFPSGEVILDSYYWNYSRTTSKYRNQFLRESTKETEQKIKDGIYKLVNLN